MDNLDKRAAWPGWETVRLIGRGSFGAVYEIRREVYGHGEKAALKLVTIPQSPSDIDELLNDGFDRDSIARRFQGYLEDIVREYAVMAEMKGCANIVYCDDLRTVRHEDGIGWDILIKMELLEALPGSLGDRVPEQQVIRIGADLCRALRYCEQRHVLHRDIKPSNIFLAPDGTYKLGDFGIAKTAEHTTGGTRTGTFKYMAPEVFQARPYGKRADLYSLGMVLYWLLNERRTPFLPLPPRFPSAAEEAEARARRFRGEPIPPPLHGSPALRRIVLKALAYEPKGRYAGAEEMLRELEELSGGEGDNSEFGMRNAELENDRHSPAADKPGPRSPAAEKSGPRGLAAVGAAISRPSVSSDAPRAKTPAGPDALIGPRSRSKLPSESVGADAPGGPRSRAKLPSESVGADAPGGPRSRTKLRTNESAGPDAPGGHAKNTAPASGKTGALSASRGPHPPQAVPLPPAGGRQGAAPEGGKASPERRRRRGLLIAAALAAAAILALLLLPGKPVPTPVLPTPTAAVNGQETPAPTEPSPTASPAPTPTEEPTPTPTPTDETTQPTEAPTPTPKPADNQGISHTHTWSEWTSNGDGTHTRSCTTCPAKETRECSYGQVKEIPATCGTDGETVYKCSVCQKTFSVIIPATGKHTKGPEVSKTEPTCGTDGETVYTCSVCQKTFSVRIPATGAHTPGTEVSRTDPTCGTYGETVYVCSVCQETFSVPIPATGAHVDTNEDGICDVCGKKMSKIINALFAPVCPDCEHDHGCSEDHCACHCCCAPTPELLQSALSASLRGLCLCGQRW